MAIAVAGVRDGAGASKTHNGGKHMEAAAAGGNNGVRLFGGPGDGRNSARAMSEALLLIGTAEATATAMMVNALNAISVPARAAALCGVFPTPSMEV